MKNTSPLRCRLLGLTFMFLTLPFLPAQQEKYVDIVFTALVFGSQPIRDWHYFNGKKKIPFRAYNLARSTPYSYHGPVRLDFFSPSIPDAPGDKPVPTASVELPLQTREIFLLFISKDQGYDILPIDSTPLAKLNAGYQFCNLTAMPLRIWLGSQSFDLHPRATHIVSPPVAEESKLVEIKMAQGTINAPFYSTSWLPEPDRVELIIIAPGHNFPQVFKFAESPSRRRQLVKDMMSAQTEEKP